MTAPGCSDPAPGSAATSDSCGGVLLREDQNQRLGLPLFLCYGITRRGGGRIMQSTVMRRAPLERLSIRAALAVGIAVTLGLWLFTGYTFTRRIDEVERRSTEVAARYTRAQELLSDVRTQVMLSSVREQ